jgi:hypothetical protein
MWLLIFFYLLPLCITCFVTLKFLRDELREGYDIRLQDISVLILAFVPILNVLTLVVIISMLFDDNPVIIRSKGKTE